MTAGGIAHAAAERIQGGQGERRGAQSRRAGSESIRFRERVGEVSVGNQPVTEDCPQLSHRGRRTHPVSDDVADDQGDDAVGQQDRVEPVAARSLLVPADQVARCQPCLAQDRQHGWHQGFLELGQDVTRRRVMTVGLGRPDWRSGWLVGLRARRGNRPDWLSAGGISLQCRLVAHGIPSQRCAADGCWRSHQTFAQCPGRGGQAPAARSAG